MGQSQPPSLPLRLHQLLLGKFSLSTINIVTGCQN